MCGMKGTIMNKTWFAVISAVLALVLIGWILGGCKISCGESFWDKDKTVIEIKK